MFTPEDKSIPVQKIRDFKNLEPWLNRGNIFTPEEIAYAKRQSKISDLFGEMDNGENRWQFAIVDGIVIGIGISTAGPVGGVIGGGIVLFSHILRRVKNDVKANLLVGHGMTTQ